MKNGNGKKIVKSFEKWSRQKVEDVFGLKLEEGAPFLTDWLTVTGTPPADVQALLVKLRAALKENVNAWNEIELFSRFIVPLLWSIDFYNPEKRIQEFAGRPFTLPDEKYEVKGNVDWFVARGRDEPETPFFFLHEYKRAKQGDSDPSGQLLIEMYAAQKHNADGFPVYGAWIAGKNWQFVLLEGTDYAESKSYQATEIEELTQIWLILNKTKQIIYDRVDKLIEAEKNKKS